MSINYEDFTEGFLTCGTCLYAYDQAEHTPKLLSCSHTICQSCLELIASSPTLNNSTEAGCIKCPICRQNIAIPNGGIGALPPSFLVNQLFDLVNKKPREFIPKCSVHIEQELLFCETCDCVFCDTCNNNNESDDSLTTASLSTTNTIFSAYSPRQQQQQLQNNKQHINEVCTVIPFSTAIKRMSEILNYRSQQCLSKLDEARENVEREVEKLESNCSQAIEEIGAAFEKIKSIVEQREKDLLEQSKKLHEYKKNVLLEQLKTIENEKSTLNVKANVKINNETDVKNLSKKISDLTNKNDSALALFTPRENCFICFEKDNDDALQNMQELIHGYGNIRTSKTYPPYCTSKLISYSTNLRSVASVQSVDYNGANQKFGGDPIQAELMLVGYNDDIDGEIKITDKRDGTYEVAFVPPVPGKYQLFIYIFNRPIKDCPLTFETNIHHNPVAVFGTSSKKGVTDQFDHFSQPASLAINKHNGRVYILDSFNYRIKVLAQIDSQSCPFSFMQHIQPEFFDRSCTGIALLYPEEDDECDEHGIQNLSLSPTKSTNPNILVADWRARIIHELNSDGKLLRQYSHDDLLEPTNIAVDSRGRIFVVDRESIFVFNSLGKLLHKLIGYKYANSHGKNRDDKSSIKKLDSFIEPEKLLNDSSEQQTIYSTDGANLLSSVQNNDNHISLTNNKEIQDKALAATLNTYLITAAAVNEKRANAKTNTLSSLISIKRKPKLNPSKAVMSAASKIRSTFTLSHSTSLVGAASLQSMFNGNKNNTISNSQQNNNQQAFDGRSVNLQDNNSGNKHKGNKFNNQQNNINETHIKQTLPIDELQEDQVSLLMISNNQNMGDMMSAMNNNGGAQNKRDGGELGDSIEPFGTIRGIAVGPNDELVVADESRIRVLELALDEYVFKREIFIGRQPGNNNSNNNNNININHHSHHHSTASTSNGRLSGMTYDAASKQLLILRSNVNTGIPFIQIVDYCTGKAKFNIDSHESKLIRPSCLVTYGQHVIVSDLGNDCIKKYRFY